MTLLFTRMFALLTLFSYLAVGTVVVRVFTAEQSEFSLSLDYLTLVKPGSIETAQLLDLKAPNQNFAEIKFPAPVKVVVVKAAKISAPIDQKVQLPILPFNEPIVLTRVEMTTQLPVDLISLYKSAPAEIEKMVANAETAKVDEVSTKMAKAEAVVDEEEPTFLEYSKDEVKTAEVSEAVDKGLEAEDKGRGAVDNGRGAVDTASVNSTEVVEVDDLVAFDYSSVNKAVVDNKVPMVSAMNTQPAQTVISGLNVIGATTPVVSTQPEVKTESKTVNALKSKSAQGFMQEETAKPNKFVGYPSEVIIHAAGTNFKKNFDVNGFELRFQDDLAESKEDFGSGAVSLKENLAQPAMTRSVVIIKRGFVPTNTDLILEQGVTELSLPLIEQETMNEEISGFESRGPVGSVLVELDDESEKATLDVSFGKVLLLDGDMKPTTKEDFRYQLFVGVKAGNALVSYKTIKGQTVSKIIHVHESEMTYEANLYENISNDKVTLFEESLLSKERSPLIIAADQVKKFVTNEESTKINDHTYRVNYEKSLLAGRRYLEITHFEEPVFVGVRDVTSVSVPSEHFMRFILSKIEGAQLANRCLIQVNLSKKITRVDVGSESVASSLMTMTQMLDQDGKFYESASEKTRKIIIVGENQGAPEYSKDGKVNLKITYENGSVQFLNSYCSPNTYLVEQL